MKKDRTQLCIGLFLTGWIFFFGTAVLSFAQDAVRQQKEAILKYKPSQPNVDVDYPSENDLAQCRLITFKEGGYVGNCLTAADGSTPLRVLCRKDAPNPSGQKADEKTPPTAEQIWYYKNGVEVFRDDYLNGECRWLGDAGQRWGVRKGKTSVEIDHWKSISPEEATSEAVAALADGDEARYRRVALSQEDLAALKINGPIADELAKQVETLADFGALSDRLAIPDGIKWGAFNGNHPALLPQGRYGLSTDLPVYFNSSVVLMDPNDPSRSHQLYIGDLVKIGDVWKIVGLPSGEPFGQPSDKVTVASTLFPSTGDGGVTGISDGAEAYAEWWKQLTDAMQNLEQASADQAPDMCEKIYQLYLDIGKNIKDANEQVNFFKEAANFLLSEIRSLRYPQGMTKLAELFESLKNSGNTELAAYVRLRQLTGEYYAAILDTKATNSDKIKADEHYKEALAAFADEYPKTPASGEALMYLAQEKEYLQENDAALSYYNSVAQDFAQTEIGLRAAGAVKRIGSVGQKFSLPAGWTYSDGSAVEIPTGKKTVLFCWVSWSLNPNDFAALKQLLADHSELAVVGLSLDGSQQVFQSAIEGLGQLPWKNIFVPAADSGEASESPAAFDLGIQAAPMFILLDEEGKMLLPNILTVDDLKLRLEPAKSATP